MVYQIGLNLLNIVLGFIALFGLYEVLIRTDSHLNKNLKWLFMGFIFLIISHILEIIPNLLESDTINYFAEISQVIFVSFVIVGMFGLRKIIMNLLVEKNKRFKKSN